MLSENTIYDVELPKDLKEVLNDFPHAVFTGIEVKAGRPVEISMASWNPKRIPWR